MMDIRMIGCILQEYGADWTVSRSLYSGKLKLMNTVPGVEKLFEKKIEYPKRLDIFEANTECLKEFIKNLPPEDKEKLIRDADKAGKGIIMGFSSIELDYGYPVNWQLNPVTLKACDGRKKWYQIPDFDEKQGDIKAIWEISRFSHFITLARAYLLTEDGRYYEMFREQLEDWLEKNPYSYGANYKCGQECSLRMVNALLAYTIFESCGMMKEADREYVKELVSRCYRKVLSNFFYAYKCIKNNHTISELMGMLVGAWCCGDNKQMALAACLLNEVIDEQFMGDGGYIQYSFNYERLALQDITVVMAAEKKTGKILNRLSRKKVLNAARLMYQCQDEHGVMPNYGSNDGALAFVLTSCEYGDFRPVVNTVHALLTGNKIYPDGKWNEELIWLSAKKESYFQYENVKKTASSFESAGLFTLRSSHWWLMVILNEYHARPGHMDQMHMDLWVRGINVFCDGGTFSYASNLGQELALNHSHNTVSYDHRDQMRKKGPFLIYGWTRRRKARQSHRAFCGEMKSQSGYSHRRIIRATDAGYQIKDVVNGENGRTFEVRFHTPCDVKKENDTLRLTWNGEIICSVTFNASCRICKSSRSLYYLEAEETKCIVVPGVIEDGKGYIETEIRIRRGTEDD